MIFLYELKKLLLAPVGSLTRGIFGLSPVMLILQSPSWFTEGGEDVIWANFECIGLTALIILSAGLFASAAKLFNKRELL
jgi:hypothetical protein